MGAEICTNFSEKHNLVWYSRAAPTSEAYQTVSPSGCEFGVQAQLVGAFPDGRSYTPTDLMGAASTGAPYIWKTLGFRSLLSHSASPSPCCRPVLPGSMLCWSLMRCWSSVRCRSLMLCPMLDALPDSRPLYRSAVGLR